MPDTPLNPAVVRDRLAEEYAADSRTHYPHPGEDFRAGWDAALSVVAAWLRTEGAQVLAGHEGQGKHCDGCGASREPGPGAPRHRWHPRHQADVLAGLIERGGA